MKHHNRTRDLEMGHPRWRSSDQQRDIRGATRNHISPEAGDHKF